MAISDLYVERAHIEKALQDTGMRYGDTPDTPKQRARLKRLNILISDYEKANPAKVPQEETATGPFGLKIPVAMDGPANPKKAPHKVGVPDLAGTYDTKKQFDKDHQEKYNPKKHQAGDDITLAEIASQLGNSDNYNYKTARARANAFQEGATGEVKQALDLIPSDLISPIPAVSDKIKDVASGYAGSTIGMLPNLASEAITLTSPKSPLVEKAGAGANIAMALAPEQIASGLAKGAKGAVNLARGAEDVAKLEPAFQSFHGPGGGDPGMPVKGSPVKPVDAPWLETAPRNPKGNLTLLQKANRLFLNRAAAADEATKALEGATGKGVAGTALDAGQAINRQTRLGAKVELTVQHGFHDAAGNKLTAGLPEIKAGMEADGIPFEDWQRYRRALRDNEVAPRRPGNVDNARTLINSKVIQATRQKYGADALAKWDQTFNAYADQHLKLYEDYGLRPEGWAKKIRAENPNYFPTDPAPSVAESRMGEVNPSKNASPYGEVQRAVKGEAPMDGLAAMAAKTESVMRAGEMTQALRPFVEEAASNPLMKDWVEEITPTLTQSEKAGRGKTQAASSFDAQMGTEPLPVEGKEPILTLLTNGEPRTYRIDPDLWGAMRGMQPQAMNEYQQILKGFAGVARAGITQKNPLFSLIFNPINDLTSATVVHGMNPLRFIQGLADAAKGVKSQAYREWVLANGPLASKGARDFIEQQWIYDPAKRSAVQAIADKALETRGVQIIKGPADKVAGGLARIGQTMEEATRLGFYKQRLDAYLKAGMDRPEALRRATQDGADLMNFGKASSSGAFASNYGAIFANVPAQALDSLAVGFKRNPKAFIARGTALLTAPKLVEMAIYKDDPQYQALPDYAKDRGLLFKAPDGKFHMLPVPLELGTVFFSPVRRGVGLITGKENATKAGVNELNTIRDAFMPNMVPQLGKAVAEATIYQQTGATVDTGFGNVRSYPAGANASEKAQGHARYAQFKQQASNALGTLGGYGAQTLGYLFGYDKAPNPLARYSPTPAKANPKKGSLPSLPSLPKLPQLPRVPHG